MGAPGTTPGVWQAGEECIRGTVAVWSGERIVALAGGRHISAYQCRIDAHQIAASGPLYDAGAKLIANFDELRATTVAERFVTGRSDAEIRKSSNEAIEELRAALALARGESPHV